MGKRVAPRYLPLLPTRLNVHLGSDFADGRVLLAILHKYAPGLTGSRRLSRENLELNHPFDMGNANAKRTLKLKILQVSNCLKAIGGVPIPGFDVRFYTSASALPSSNNSSGSFNLEKDIPVPQPATCDVPLVYVS